MSQEMGTNVSPHCEEIKAAGIEKPGPDDTVSSSLLPKDTYMYLTQHTVLTRFPNSLQL